METETQSAPKIVLEAGKRYLTRGGRVAVVTSSNPVMSDGYIVRGAHEARMGHLSTCWWTVGGVCGGNRYPNRDIVGPE